MKGGDIMSSKYYIPVKKQYYLKDKKAQIYKTIHGEIDASGYPLPDRYCPIASLPVWCYARQLSQEQLYAAMAASQDETKLFIFNYHSCVNMYDLVCYKGTWYEITRVDTKDDYNGELFVYVKLYPNGSPKPEQIEPYDPSRWE